MVDDGDASGGIATIDDGSTGKRAARALAVLRPSHCGSALSMTPIGKIVGTTAKRRLSFAEDYRNSRCQVHVAFIDSDSPYGLM